MNEKDFMLIMELIDGAYQNFKLTENTLKTYYHFLKKYKNKDLWDIASYWIRNNNYAPTVKDLLDTLKFFEVEENNNEHNS